MYRFEHTVVFFAFLIVPLMLLLALLWFYLRRKRLARFADSTLLKTLNPYDSKRKRGWKLVLFLLGFSVLILAMCNLQTGSKLTEVKREGADIIVCLDVSNSMLAQDLTPNRLVRAKFALEKMIDMLQGDRLGLVIFAGEAYVQLPITTDYAAAKMFLGSINPGMLPVQGTNLADAIKKASESFSSDEGKNRAIILITDGENHDSEAIEAAEHAAGSGIMINTIGIGSENGVPIPLVENGQVKGYRKDREGQTVITRLNSALLKTIAQKGGGVYVQATQADLGLDNVLDKMEELDKSQLDSKLYTDYEDQFQWFALLALILLTLEFIISERASEWYLRSNLFGKPQRKVLGTMLLGITHVFTTAQDDAKLLYEGNVLYHTGRFPQAAEKFSRSAEENAANRKANFNLGNALYKGGMMLKEGKVTVPQSQNMTPDSLAKQLFDRAAQNFAVVANSVSDPDTLHRAWHNIGNCYLQKKEFREAVNAYKKALRHDPSDEETRYNLAYALKNLPKEEKKGGGGGGSPKQDKQQEQQDKNQAQSQPQMTKEQAEQLLKAMMSEEKKLQDKRRQKQQDASRSGVDKDW